MKITFSAAVADTIAMTYEAGGVQPWSSGNGANGSAGGGEGRAPQASSLDVRFKKVTQNPHRNRKMSSTSVELFWKLQPSTISQVSCSTSSEPSLGHNMT